MPVSSRPMWHAQFAALNSQHLSHSAVSVRPRCCHRGASAQEVTPACPVGVGKTLPPDLSGGVWEGPFGKGPEEYLPTVAGDESENANNFEDLFYSDAFLFAIVYAHHL